MLEELEETLIAADLGRGGGRGAFVKRVRDEIKRGRVVYEPGRAGAAARLPRGDARRRAPAPLDLDAQPTVILMLGVNGAGQDDEHGQARRVPQGRRQERDDRGGRHLPRRGHRAARGVGRAAPTWRSSARPRAPIPSAVVFDAVKAAHARGIDVLLVDTAGRLHTKSNLMDELIKLKKVDRAASCRARPTSA